MGGRPNRGNRAAFSNSSGVKYEKRGRCLKLGYGNAANRRVCGGPDKLINGLTT